MKTYYILSRKTGTPSQEYGLPQFTEDKLPSLGTAVCKLKIWCNWENKYLVADQRFNLKILPYF